MERSSTALRGCFIKISLLRSIFMATGIVALAYVVKLIVNKSKKASEKSAKSLKESKETDKAVEQFGESFVESNKTAEQADEKNTEQSNEEITEQASENNKDTSESKVIPVERKLDDVTGAMKVLKLKPNYFVAFPVNNVGIHNKVKALQKKIIKKNPLLFPAIVNVSTLHVTLAVTHLASEKDINNVKNKLDEWAANNLKAYFEKPCILSFKGVKTFNDVVAYVGIEPCESHKRITDLSKQLNDILSSAGYLTDDKRFTPHLTFLKLSKDFKLIKLKGSFKNNFQSLRKCNDHFGIQEVSCMQLLSMNDSLTESGYYKCVHEIKLSNVNEPTMDHKECCTPLKKPNIFKK